jgi:hypothetical protein
MGIVVCLLLGLLFFLLVPGVLFKIPANGSAITVAFIHGLIFAFIYYFTYEIVLKQMSGSGVCISGMCHGSYGDCIRKGNGDSC